MKKGKSKFLGAVGEDWEKIPNTIGFRLDEEHRLVLAERARALKLGIHELARIYVMQMLHETDERQQIITALVALRDELREARKDISVSTQELMVSGGKATNEQAEKWVEHNLV